MRVIGIDPGYDRLGVAVVEQIDGTESVVFSDCIETDKHLSLGERIKHIGDAFAALLQEHHPTALGIETIFFNKNQKTAIGVAQARGVIMYLAQNAGCAVYELGPQEVKIAVTGYGKSDKQAVIDMTKRLASNVPQQALDDEYDAIAIAITCLAHCR